MSNLARRYGLTEAPTIRTVKALTSADIVKGKEPTQVQLTDQIIDGFNRKLAHKETEIAALRGELARLTLENAELRTAVTPQTVTRNASVTANRNAERQKRFRERKAAKADGRAS